MLSFTSARTTTLHRPGCCPVRKQPVRFASVIRSTSAAAAVLLVTACALSACSSGSVPTAAAADPVSKTASPSPSPKPKPKPVPPRAVVTRTRTADGSLITVARFTGPVRYVLHDGSGDPYAPPGELRAGSAVTGKERGELLAVFNGGFKMNAAAGGYKQEGHVLDSLLPGLTSLVISRTGSARIMDWPSSGHVPGAWSVRQNLHPLVWDGRPSGGAYQWGLWGATLGGGEYVARSAVGEDAHGDLIYVAGMSTTPYDLAVALCRAGARIGMELDINPEWVQLDVAGHPGGTLRAEVPGQYRPASQYLYGWTRDFVTVVS